MKAKLEIGQNYWIFDGQMIPLECTLTEIVNDGRTAMFGATPRKATSVYRSKEEAEKANIY